MCDVNVLIYAFRSDTDDHRQYKEWLESVINGPSAYGVTPQGLSNVVRICTHRRIFAHPSSVADASNFCRVILEQPNATAIVPGDRHWSQFESLCQDSKATGNVVQNAWFAALAIASVANGLPRITTTPDSRGSPGDPHSDLPPQRRHSRLRPRQRVSTAPIHA